MFDEAHIPDGATQYKCCPPIRDAANQDVLWAGLLDGTIDLVVSDHSPSTAERKFAGDGDFQVAWGGISGLQFGLPAVWTEARRRGVPLETVVGWFSASTADFAGLTDEGAHRPRARTPTSRSSLRRRRTASPSTSCAHATASAPTSGTTCVGVVRTTYLARRADRPGRAAARPTPHPALLIPLSGAIRTGSWWRP